MKSLLNSIVTPYIVIPNKFHKTIYLFGLTGNFIGSYQGAKDLYMNTGLFNEMSNISQYAKSNKRYMKRYWISYDPDFGSTLKGE